MKTWQKGQTCYDTRRGKFFCGEVSPSRNDYDMGKVGEESELVSELCNKKCGLIKNFKRAGKVLKSSC